MTTVDTSESVKSIYNYFFEASDGQLANSRK